MYPFFYLVIVADSLRKEKPQFKFGAKLGIYDENIKEITEDRFLTITITKYGFYSTIITI